MAPPHHRDVAGPTNSYGRKTRRPDFVNEWVFDACEEKKFCGTGAGLVAKVVKVFGL